MAGMGIALGRGAVKLQVAVAEEHRSKYRVRGHCPGRQDALSGIIPLSGSAYLFMPPPRALCRPGCVLPIADKGQETVYRKQIATNCRYPKGYASSGCTSNKWKTG